VRARQRRAKPVPTFSIVIPTLNEGAMLRMTVESAAQHADGADYEVLVVDDGSTDGSTEIYKQPGDPRVRLIRGGALGVARARNLGARHARGDCLIFMDAHCKVSYGWLRGFADLLSIPGVGLGGPCFRKLETPMPRGCGMRWPDYRLDPCWFEPLNGVDVYSVPLTTGACQAFHRDTFEALGRYDAGFTRWGFEDVEMCLRAWLFGYQVAVHPGITIAHYFREARDNYEVDDTEITCNFLRMVYLHFRPTRIQQVLQAAKGNPFLATAQERLAESDVFERRAELFARRVRDDEWFFQEVNGVIGVA